MKTAVVVAVVLGFAALPSSGVAQAAPASAPDGAALYQQHCRSCHGPAGIPPAAMQRMFTGLAPMDSAFFAGRTEDSLVAVMRNGAGRNMRSFKEKLTAEQMVAVAKYLRTLATPRREGAP